MMRWLLAVCLAAASVSRVPADEIPDPLRLVPRQADVVLRIEPRQLADAVRSLPALMQLSQFPAVRDALSSTNSQRFAKLIGYYEKELGAPWPELLDQLAWLRKRTDLPLCVGFGISKPEHVKMLRDLNLSQ